MKKILLMATAAMFMMTSCSDDDSTSNDNNTNVVLLKKTIEQSAEGTVTSTYTYDGNKLIKVSRGADDYEEYSYNGDQITSIKYYEGELIQEDKFSYNGDNKLSTFVTLSYDVEWGSKYEYTYNQDGTVTVKEYIGNLESQTQLNSTGTVTYSNGNITKYETGSQKTEYTFDTKNFPLKNIAGYDAMVLSYMDGGVNNQVTYQLIENTEVTESSVYTYTYNSDNFPATSNEVLTYGDEDEEISTQYFYE